MYIHVHVLYSMKCSLKLTFTVRDYKHYITLHLLHQLLLHLNQNLNLLSNDVADIIYYRLECNCWRFSLAKVTCYTVLALCSINSSLLLHACHSLPFTSLLPIPLLIEIFRSLKLHTKTTLRKVLLQYGWRRLLLPSQVILRSVL